MSLVDEAVRYAKWWGMHVFPIDPGSKTPAFRRAHPVHENCPEGMCGHKHASVDPDTIKGMWAAYPDAWIGIWLAPSGLMVVDVDPRNGGWLPRGLPATWWATTGGGGTHHYFKVADGVELPGQAAEGVDLKHNGYVIMAPSPGYRWQLGAAMAKWPGKTFKAAPAYEGPRYEYTGPGEATDAAIGYLRPYGQRFQAAIEFGAGRNNALFLLARVVGQLVAGGEVREAGTLEWLEQVGRDAGVSGARSTARSGFRTGRDKDKPLQLTFTDENGRTRTLVTAGRSAA